MLDCTCNYHPRTGVTTQPSLLHQTTEIKKVNTHRPHAEYIFGAEKIVIYKHNKINFENDMNFTVPRSTADTTWSAEAIICYSATCNSPWW